MDWFFTAGGDPEDYVTSQYIDVYNDFIIELYRSKDVKKSFEEVLNKHEKLW